MSEASDLRAKLIATQSALATHIERNQALTAERDRLREEVAALKNDLRIANKAAEKHAKDSYLKGDQNEEDAQTIATLRGLLERAKVAVGYTVESAKVQAYLGDPAFREKSAAQEEKFTKLASEIESALEGKA